MYIELQTLHCHETYRIEFRTIPFKRALIVLRVELPFKVIHFSTHDKPELSLENDYPNKTGHNLKPKQLDFNSVKSI